MPSETWLSGITEFLQQVLSNPGPGIKQQSLPGDIVYVVVVLLYRIYFVCGKLPPTSTPSGQQVCTTTAVQSEKLRPLVQIHVDQPQILFLNVDRLWYTPYTSTIGKSRQLIHPSVRVKRKYPDMKIRRPAATKKVLAHAKQHSGIEFTEDLVGFCRVCEGQERK